MLKRTNPKFDGLLVFGDPHLEGRQPNFRKDNYPNVILEKIEFCLQYCRDHNLQPVCLGDVFDKPRDNPNWIIGELIEMTRRTPIVGIFGNHDCAQPQLNDDDSLSVLVKAGGYKIVSSSEFWTGEVNGRRLVVAGSSYRHPIPEVFDTRLVPAANDKSSNDGAKPPLVVWLTHHDIDFKGYDSGRFSAHEIENVDVLINGHIHRRLDPIVAGKTTWINPGNIARRSRSEANQTHIPKALHVKVSDRGLKFEDVIIPHKSFEDVFYEAMIPTEDDPAESAFISGLKELTHRKTASGAGLNEFLKENLDQFEPDVADQILTLAKEITQEDIHSHAKHDRPKRITKGTTKPLSAISQSQDPDSDAT